MNSQLERIVASETDPKFATGVELTNKDGQKEIVEADFIVMGVGVAPATEFLKQSDGFPQGVLQKDGGVLVDEYLKVRGLDDVYAIGDIAVYPLIPQGGEARIEHWNVAGNHGRAVGKSISGSPVPFSKTPIFWSGREYPPPFGTTVRSGLLTWAFLSRLGCRGPEFEVLWDWYWIRGRCHQWQLG